MEVSRSKLPPTTSQPGRLGKPCQETAVVARSARRGSGTYPKDDHPPIANQATTNRTRRRRAPQPPSPSPELGARDDEDARPAVGGSERRGIREFHKLCRKTSTRVMQSPSGLTRSLRSPVGGGFRRLEIAINACDYVRIIESSFDFFFFFGLISSGWSAGWFG